MFKGKAIILVGARQTGKTTLLKTLLKNEKMGLWLNADNPDVHTRLENISPSGWKKLIGKNKVIVIDEAQRIENIGLKIKLITDELKGIQLIATGSSSFELSSKVNEPLTGRKWEYMLYPISYGEMANYHGIIEESSLIEHRLIYGYYPEVMTAESNEKEILKQLTDSYLYKDLLMLDSIKRSNKIINLLQALALQLGNEVSYSELGKLLGMDNQTVEKYIDLLEKSFVIFRLNAFSRNLRNELKRSRKIYFYDNGVRNALLANFSPLSLRSDVGPLWENFLIAERMKFLSYNQKWVNSYFWRSHEQQEIDYI
ncbi:MAG: AAA family ATPase [Bacteroidota bacterium]|nr:AAA family ATPase [Bacteroidota bacterium]